MHTRLSIVIVSIFAVSCFAQLAGQSPAEQSIALAKSGIEKNPSKFNSYNELAIALTRRARETSDNRRLDQAEAAAQESLSLAPNNFEALKAQVAMLLGKHEVEEARVKAQQLNHNVPDDVIVYGYIADADIELGNYEEAEKATQWMLDLRPHNIPGLIRGASLRSIFGDPEGAIEFLNDAYQQTLPDQLEDLAFILTRMADLDFATGKVQLADQLLDKALRSFPDYYLALEGLARVRTAQGRYSEAAELLQKRNQKFPQPKSIYEEAKALERAGKMEEAKPLYADFERQARLEVSQPDNVNRELIFYYLEHTHNPLEAMGIARQAAARRHDVFLLDAYALALYANGDYEEARKQIEKALTPGVRDAGIFFHAAMISSKLNDRSAAQHYLETSLELNPVSEVSGEVRRMLARSSAGLKGESKR